MQVSVVGGFSRGRERGTYEFASRRDDESTQSILRAPPLPEENLENGDEESERLAASGPGGTEDVLAL